MRLESLAAVLFACSFLVNPAHAQAEFYTPVVTGSGGAAERKDTRGYIGFAWSVGAGASIRPDLVLGVQRIEITADDDLMGLDLNARIGLDGKVGRIALSGLKGTRNSYANLGVGYDFRAKSVIGTVSLQTARLRIGGDYALQASKFIPYVELNTLARPDAVNFSAGTLSCATPGYVLVTRSDERLGQSVMFFDEVILANGYDVDGRGCIDSSFLLS